MSIIADTLKNTKLGNPVSFQNLTIHPLLNGSSAEAPYLTLDEALGLKQFRVTEVSEGGSVPELKVVNEGEQPVLLLDGEELIGAKQNRILNLTILVASKSTLVVPVSCVESGRWSHVSKEFAAAPRAQYAAGRARKMAGVSDSMLKTGERRSNQGEVWADIDAKAHRMAAPSHTSAMSAIFEAHAHTLEYYVAAFTAAANQSGAVFSIGGRVAGADLFDSAATFAKLFPKLLRSYAMDAIDTAAWPAGKTNGDDVEQFLRQVAGTPAQRFKAVGQGHDLRFNTRDLSGAALEEGDRLVHLCAFQMARAGSERAENTGMTPPSVRRRHRQ